VLAAASAGSLHDPRCAHHPGNGAESPWDLGTPHEHTGARTSASEHSHGTSHEQAPDDCSCPGGLCALGADRVYQQASPSVASLDAGRETWSAPEAHTACVARPELRTQPPGRAPPTEI
jgi:hypothetical protein